ncbi:MAG: alcohol dehydrogenase catalytic domain-containing protein, partial [Verrucomicrobiota bacterium]
MKAIKTSPQGPRLYDVPIPSALNSQAVLVEVRAVSICRTDLYVANGQIPAPNGLTLGHEFTGVVSHVGSGVSLFERGDRVVGNPFLSCGACDPCKKEQRHLCIDDTFLGVDRNGAFAEYVVVPQLSLSRLHEEVSFSVGTFSEPVAAGLGIFESIALQASKDLAIGVYGSGRIGKLTLALLYSRGYRAEIMEAIEGDSVFDVIIESQALGEEVESMIR